MTSEPRPQEVFQLPPFPPRTFPLPSSEAQARILNDQRPCRQVPATTSPGRREAVSDFAASPPAWYGQCCNSGKTAAQPREWAQSTDTSWDDHLLWDSKFWGQLLDNKYATDQKVEGHRGMNHSNTKQEAMWFWKFYFLRVKTIKLDKGKRNPENLI